MANLLQQGAAFLAGALKAHAGTPAVYRRGAASCPVTLTLTGRYAFRLADELGGTRVAFSDLDAILPAADLVFDGAVSEPCKGDQVEITRAGALETYQVLAPDTNEAPWRYCDPAQTLIRLHLKRVGVDRV